jgi:hypothetical protein
LIFAFDGFQLSMAACRRFATDDHFAFSFSHFFADTLQTFSPPSFSRRQLSPSLFDCFQPPLPPLFLSPVSSLIERLRSFHFSARCRRLSLNIHYIH